MHILFHLLIKLLELLAESGPVGRAIVWGLIVVFVGLTLWATAYGMHVGRRTKRLKRAMDHWRSGETRKALKILDKMQHLEVARTLRKAIHDGQDGNTWHITFRGGEKY